MITLLQVIQCGRHNDIFKFWLAWRAKGSLGFESQMNRCRSWQPLTLIPWSFFNI